MNAHTKPLGRKAYGSIPHLPGSRLGPSDSAIAEGQARIACEQVRDKHDRVIVTEKLDGSNCAVAKHNGRILALTRAGYLAHTSPFEMHHMFERWVELRRDRYDAMLREGERVSGEWLIQVHGTRYEFDDPEMLFCAFDIIRGDERVLHDELVDRCDAFEHRMVPILSDGPPVSIEQALKLAGPTGSYGGLDDVEGAVWRVERKGRVDFVTKYVRHDKVDGKFLPSVTNCAPIWNWEPADYRNLTHIGV